MRIRTRKQMMPNKGKTAGQCARRARQRESRHGEMRLSAHDSLLFGAPVGGGRCQLLQLARLPHDPNGHKDPARVRIEDGQVRYSNVRHTAVGLVGDEGWGLSDAAVDSDAADGRHVLRRSFAAASPRGTWAVRPTATDTSRSRRGAVCLR